jgi:hypothetical protein
MKAKDNRLTLQELFDGIDEKGNLNPKLLEHYEVVRTDKSIKINYKNNKK